MLTSGNGLTMAAAGDRMTKATDIEQVLAFFRDRSFESASAKSSARTLQTRLDALRRNVPAFSGIELSDHVLSLLRSSQAD